MAQLITDILPELSYHIEIPAFFLWDDGWNYVFTPRYMVLGIDNLLAQLNS